MKVVVKIIMLNKDPATTVVLIIIVFLLLELTWPAHKTQVESKAYDFMCSQPLTDLQKFEQNNSLAPSNHMSM
jgi:hypothetical protein